MIQADPERAPALPTCGPRRVASAALWCLVLALAPPAGIAAEPVAPPAVKVVIEGVEELQLASVRDSLAIVAYETRKSLGQARLERLVAQVPDQVRDALEPFGYYNPTTVTALGAEGARPRQVVVAIERGAPVLVRSVEIEVVGAAARNERIADLIKTFRPAKGEIFDHAIYEASKARIERALQRRGYFDQVLHDPRVAISRQDNTADIKLSWASGTRYLLGDISFEGAQFDDAFLRRYLPWKTGDRYDQQRIEALQQALAVSNYFSSIEVVPDIEQATELRVPIRVSLKPAKRSAYSAGVSYDTDYGAGVRFGIDRRWVNLRGDMLSSETEIAQNLRYTSLDYRIPHQRDARRFYVYGARYRDEETDVVDARSTLVSAGIARASENWNGTLAVNALTGSFVVGSRELQDQPRNSLVLYPELIVTRVFARDRIRPDRGASLRLGVRAASESLASDASLLQGQIEGRLITSFTPETRMLLRCELGATQTDHFERLPPELRFFAGGDRSVRGYAYQSLGDRDARGTAIGGRYLTTASIEFEHEFIPAWSGAVFVDAGDVFSEGRPHLSTGVGVGVRWASPVGPIRLDIAHGLDDPDNSFELHISAGPDL